MAAAFPKGCLAEVCFLWAVSLRPLSGLATWAAPKMAVYFFKITLEARHQNSTT